MLIDILSQQRSASLHTFGDVVHMFTGSKGEHLRNLLPEMAKLYKLRWPYAGLVDHIRETTSIFLSSASENVLVVDDWTSPFEPFSNFFTPTTTLPQNQFDQDCRQLHFQIKCPNEHFVNDGEIIASDNELMSLIGEGKAPTYKSKQTTWLRKQRKKLHEGTKMGSITSQAEWGYLVKKRRVVALFVKLPSLSVHFPY